MMKAKKLGGSLSYGSLSYGCLFFTIFIFTSLIFSNCARKKERKQLVVVKDEFEKVEEFVLDEKTGQELAKNQILIYIVNPFIYIINSTVYDMSGKYDKASDYARFPYYYAENL